MFKRSRPQASVSPPAAAPREPAAIAEAVSAGKAAYEARRAAKAGMSLEKWKAEKARQARLQIEAEAKARPAAAKPPGLFKRLLDRAHKPL